MRPSSARNKAGKPSRRKRQNRRRSELPEAGRKTHVPANAASRTRSQSDRLADRPRDPSPSANSRPAPLRHTESTKPDFVNGLLDVLAESVPTSPAALITPVVHMSAPHAASTSPKAGHRAHRPFDKLTSV